MFPIAISNRFEDALFSRNSQKLQIVMRDFLLQTASAFDVSYEAFYQGMMLGLCAVMYENYWLSGNRESGDGRYDIQLKPKQREWPGILIELKVYRGKKAGVELQKELDQLSKQAILQMESNSYETELRAYGCKEILEYGMAFQGKKVAVASRVM